jgi:glycosyltransferase involved in cell wall biosynthesis
MTQRIAFITHSGYPSEPRARRMAEAVAAHGYAVDVFCVRWPQQADFERLNGVAIYRLPLARRQGGGARAYLAEYLRSFALAAWRVSRQHVRDRYALIQVYNPPDILAFSTLLPRLFSRTRIVLDVRDMAPELFMSRFGLRPDHPITRTLRAHERWACRYADAVTVCSEYQRNVMAARGIAPGKMTVVMNTPDPAIFGEPVPLPRPPAPPGKPFTLLFHGSILERYGVGTLIEAIPLLAPEIPDLRLAFHGTGDFEPAAQALAQRLGVENIVSFHGLMPLEAMPALIATADIGVVPTRRDVFTQTIIATRLFEYVHMGVPAVAARLAAAAECFTDDMVAYFEPGDPADLARQVLALYRDRERGQAMARNARCFSAGHNWTHDGAVYTALIDRLLGAQK